MTPRTSTPRRLLAGIASLLLVGSVGAVPVATAAPTNPDLVVTLELPAGDVDYQLELGELYLYDDEEAPFVIQVLDGCDINDRLWVFGAGLSGLPVPMTLLDVRSGESHRTVLPPFEPGAPIGTILEPDALPVCGDEPAGGLPTLSGTASLIAAGGRGDDYGDVIELRSEGSVEGYTRLIRGGTEYAIGSRGSPVVAVDQSDAFDELVLLAEGRTPRRLEGVVFQGREGMLPSEEQLARSLKGIERSRVRRAFETAKNRRVPAGIIEDLGLRRVDEVHHISLDFETLGADAYLTIARWIAQHGDPVRPPVPVEERFRVEIARANGERSPVPIVGPLVGSDAEGRLWEYRSDEALVQVIDACDLSGSHWLLAGTRTEEPVELVLTDTRDGTETRRILWTDREEVSRLSDSALLAGCP